MEVFGSLVGLIIGIVLGSLVIAIMIWIVSKLGLGLEVSGFGPAFIAGFVISILSALITWGLGALGMAPAGGLIGAIVYLIISALVLMFAGNMVKGLRVNGFIGALVAAIAIAVLFWLFGLIF